MRQGGIAHARRRARALVRRFGVRSPEHIRVYVFAAALGVQLVEAPLHGAIAQLVCNGTHAHILIPEAVTDPGALSFSIAHELGHFVLEHPSCSPDELFAPRPRGSDPHVRDFEAEANAFAAELLMPADLVEPHCAMTPVDLHAAWGIARAFRVSILAAARRYAELSPHPCCAVFASEGSVLWATASAAFEHAIPDGTPLHPDALAFQFFTTGQALDDRPHTLPAHAWIDASVGTQIVEHSICSRQFATTLSMLWLPGSSK